MSTMKPARLLAPEVLKGYEKRAELGTIPQAKLAEIIELRAVIRELCAHVRAQEALIAGLPIA